MFKFKSDTTKALAIFMLCLVIIVIGAAIAAYISVSSLTPKRDLHCETNINCIGPMFRSKAEKECSEEIERGAKFDIRWKNGTLESRFPIAEFPDETAIASLGVVRYRGDLVMFQNGYSAWSRYVYWCDYDTKTEKVIEVQAVRGRLTREEMEKSL